MMLKAIAYADKWVRRFWQRVSSNVSVNPESLGVFRVIVGLFLLLFYAPYSLWLREVPQAFFDPPLLSFANLFNNFPPAYVLYSLDMLGLVSLGLLTVGVKTRIATFTLFFTGIVSKNFLYSFGKIDHDILLWALLLCMMFSGWGTKFALLPDKPAKFDRPRLALSLLAVLTAFGMFTAGFQKVFFWLDFDPNTSGFLNWFYSGYHVLERTDLLAPLIPLIPAALFELVDYVAVVFELTGFVFLLLGRRAWRAWLVTAAAFHLVNILTLNITFNAHLLVYFAFVDFVALGQRFRLKPPNFMRGVAVLTFILVTVRAVRLSLGQGSSFLFVGGPAVTDPVILYVSSVFWMFAIAVLLSNLYLSTTNLNK